MKKLFICALAALAFAACSKDTGPGTQPDPEPDFGPEAWVSINFPKGALGRSLHNPNTDNGSADERALKTVRAILFNTSNQVTKDVTLTTAGSPAQTGGDAFKVPSSSKKILIVANAPANFPNTFAEGADYDVVVNAVKKTYDTDPITVLDLKGGSGSGDANNGFMMTNARGALESITLYPSEAEAEAAPTNLNLDRVLAKVEVMAQNPSSNTPNVTISDVQWILNVTNRKFFPVSVRTPTFLNTPSPMDVVYQLGSYRIDPNYTDNHTSFPFTTASASTAYNAEYSYYTQANYSSIPWNDPNTTGVEGSGLWEYCLENTQTKDGNFHAYTTHALIEAKYAPSKFYVPTDATGVPTGSADASGDWIKISSSDDLSNTFFTYNSILLWIKAELTNYFQHIENGNPASTYPTPITTSYNAFVEAVTGTPVDLSYTKGDGVDTKAEAARIAFNTKNDAVKLLTEGKMVGNCYFYKGGKSYWQVMVKHDDDNDKTNNELGEFGVVRNSQYTIKITKFNNPGYPVVPDPDPEKRDEDSEGWLSVQINVNPWTWYYQEEEL